MRQVDMSKREVSSMAKLVPAGVLAVILCATIMPGAEGAAGDEAIPALSSADLAWVKVGDDFIPPASGPRPVTFDKAHPYQPNNDLGLQPTYRVADLTNPILKPWAIEQMKKANDEVLAGKTPFRARSSCVPGGVPNFLIYGRLEPVYFVQTKNEVAILNQADAQTRHVYMNVPHSAHPALSWYGESVGHYEGGDTLVVDTIAQNDKTFVDDYRTPHTAQLHVIERFQLIDGGKTIEVKVRVEDSGAYNMPWDAIQRYRRTEDGPMIEMVCAENNTGYFKYDVVPLLQADKPDF